MTAAVALAPLPAFTSADGRDLEPEITRLAAALTVQFAVWCDAFPDVANAVSNDRSNSADDDRMTALSEMGDAMVNREPDSILQAFALSPDFWTGDAVTLWLGDSMRENVVMAVCDIVVMRVYDANEAGKFTA